MKKLIMLKCALLLCVFLNAQTKANQLNTSINNLAQQLKTDPNNPLKIDNQFLNQLATAVPDGSLKNKLLQYSTQLGTDKNLSYRQVYWDVLQTLNSNPQNAKLAQFAQTQQSLDLLINKSKFVVNALKGDLNLVQATTFLSDPQFLTSLSKLTGAKTALNISSGLGAVVNFMNQVNENKQRLKDAESYVEMSNMMVYPETNEQLSAALIDACVGNYYHEITPMYRYEFNNGNALIVEDGMLKWVNADGKIKKNLIKVSQRHDGTFTQEIQTTDGYVKIISDEKYIMIQPGSKSYNGLLEKSRVHVLDVNNGEEVAKYKERYYGRITPNNFESEKLSKWEHYEGPLGAPGGLWKCENKAGEKKETHPFDIKLPKKAGFMIEDKMRDKDFALFLKKFSVVETPKLFISLITGFDQDFKVQKETNASFARSMLAGQAEPEAKSDPADPNSYLYRPVSYSTFLHISDYQNKLKNSEPVYNKFTAFANSKSGNLYVTTADGSLGIINHISEIDNPDDFITKLKEIPSKPVLTAYNFIEKRDPKLFSLETGTVPYKFPELKLTPDEKHLIYTIKEELFVIDANDISKIKKYKMTFQIINSLFAKENGEYTLHLYGTNEFMITIAKKYSINKLAADYNSVKSIPVKEEKAVSKNNLKTTKKVTTPTKTTKATPTSLGDEIQKLKKLYDDGVLSKDEYEKAKKKLLDN